eukprot:3829-Heterococcus_DN1.PRE.3
MISTSAATAADVTTVTFCDGYAADAAGVVVAAARNPLGAVVSAAVPIETAAAAAAAAAVVASVFHIRYADAKRQSLPMQYVTGRSQPHVYQQCQYPSITQICMCL